MMTFESSLVRKVSTEASSSCFVSIFVQSSLGLFLASFPETVSHLLPVMLVLFSVLQGMFLLWSAEILSIPSPKIPKASLVLFLFFVLLFATSQNSVLVYVSSRFLSRTTCFYLSLCFLFATLLTYLCKMLMHFVWHHSITK